jgi:tRNA (mo5U34)-methyltransferase
MIDYSPLYQRLVNTRLEPLAEALPALLSKHFSLTRHGDLTRWLAALETLPKLAPLEANLNADSVTIGNEQSCDDVTRQQIKTALRQLMPWRKGPFSVYGVFIDTEWRSDWKWNRLKDHIQPLQGRTVLDVGCGNGYHCWRMAGAGAELVIGIDPSPLFVVQHQAIQHFVSQHNTFVLPLGIEHLPAKLGGFDTVFSMGVLYHRRSPLDHLMELRDCLRPGGELVLETLVVDGAEGEALLPRDRYAMMRNVWFIPSCPTLELWLQRCGFADIRLVDVSVTSTEEQRATDWMRFDSLADYLDPDDPGRTAEGYPAPRRAILTAIRP